MLSKQHIESLTKQHGSPLFVIDCQQLAQNYNQLSKALPKVDLFYAIKALPHVDVIRCLDQCGAYFEMASTGEAELLRQSGVAPRWTIHTHPIKRDDDIRQALRFGCTCFVIDNIDELQKFIPYRNRVGLLLRLSFRSPDATVDLSKKFGCAPEKALQLIIRARQLGIHIKGICFHIGSQNASPDMHVTAINQSLEIMKSAESVGVIMNTLDIGGGYPVPYTDGAISIEEYCAPLAQALQAVPSHIRVIAEPGRYLVASAATTICTITGKAKRGEQTWYYLDDGVYGSFSGKIYDHADYPVRCLKDDTKLYPSVLAGPTCDSIDVIKEHIMLPELAIGDIIVADMMGAYTMASATEFNCINKPVTVIINQVDNAQRRIAFKALS